MGRDLRKTLDQRSPEVRRLLQRVLNGRRVPCVPFREPGRKGYTFREEEIPYSGLMSNDIGGPNGIWSSDVFPVLPFEGMAVVP